MKDKKLYLFRVNYFDSIYQENRSRDYLRSYSSDEVKFAAKDFVIYYRSLTGVRNVKLDVIELIMGDNIFTGLGL